MNPVTECSMAVDSTFNSIVNEIQLSKLNFVIQLTPFSANITLKRSTQLDKDGVPCQPSPPLFMLLQQAYHEQFLAKQEIAVLKDNLQEWKNKCEKLKNDNTVLSQKLLSSNETLSAVHEANQKLSKKVDVNEKDITKHLITKEDLVQELKIHKNKVSQHESDTDSMTKAFNKTLKSKEKEIHNLSKTLDNARDTISSLKLGNSDLKKSESMLQSDLKKLEIRLRNLEGRKKQKCTVSSQTHSSIDVPYLVTDELPPIFGSTLCVRSKPVLLSNSLPDLSTRVMETEDDLLLEADDGLKCKTCFLSFKSQQELEEHDRVYTYCCRECFICFKTLQESQNHLC